jgi:hypothetical protein
LSANIRRPAIATIDRHQISLVRKTDDEQDIVQNGTPIATARRLKAFWWIVVSKSPTMPRQFELRHMGLRSPRGCLAYVGNVLDTLRSPAKAA